MCSAMQKKHLIHKIPHQQKFDAGLIAVKLILYYAIKQTVQRGITLNNLESSGFTSGCYSV